MKVLWSFLLFIIFFLHLCYNKAIAENYLSFCTGEDKHGHKEQN
jgi:hypothetical protein